jgi:hypothetical protein
MKLTNSTEVAMNLHTHECHSAEKPLPQCNTAYIKDETILTYKAAKELKADPCGHCWPGKSHINNGKKDAVEVPLVTTGLF